MDKYNYLEEDCGLNDKMENLLTVKNLKIGFPEGVDYDLKYNKILKMEDRADITQEKSSDSSIVAASLTGSDEIRKMPSKIKERNRLEVTTVVNGISFQIKKGEILGIVGESGSGKSMTALAILRLLSEEARIYDGSILFGKKNLLEMDEKEIASIRGREIAMIFQEPMTSLNPVMKIGAQVEEVLKIHTTLSQEERSSKVLKIFKEVGLESGEKLYNKYPHELSGGMRQRVMIAMAMICKPKLLIADEPTTALDVTIQLQILKLMKRLNHKYGTSILFISHDLGVIRTLCHRTLVMNHGDIVESGSVIDVLDNPKEEYTKRLINANPSVLKSGKKRSKKQNLKSIQKEEIKDRDSKDKNIVLEVNGLEVFYTTQGRGLFSKKKRKKIVDGVSFSVREGEIYGIVGESGSGKTTLVKAVAGLIKDKNNGIQLNDVKPQMVFQDPYGSLNPVKKIGWILEEPLKIRGGMSKEERRQLISKIIKDVGLSDSLLERYPHQLSGGQRQRVSIAAALILNSKLILLDEPVSALDVTIQAQILRLILRLREEYGLTYLFISHDLNVIRQVCDRVGIMYQGKLIEEGKVDNIFHEPKEDYTKKLLEAIL